MSVRSLIIFELFSFGDALLTEQDPNGKNDYRNVVPFTLFYAGRTFFLFRYFAMSAPVFLKYYLFYNEYFYMLTI